MTVPLDVRNDIRSMDADGVPRAGTREEAAGEPQHRREVRRHGGHVAGAAAARAAAQARARGPRGLGRVGARGRPRGAPQAAPHRQEGLRQARRRARLRGVLLDGPQARARLAAGAVGGRRRGLPGARVAGWDLPGRLRQLPCRRRRRGARPQAAGGGAAALRRPPVRRGAPAGVGVHVRGAGRDIRALGARPG